MYISGVLVPEVIREAASRNRAIHDGLGINVINYIALVLYIQHGRVGVVARRKK